MTLMSVADVIECVNGDIVDRQPPIGTYWYECGADRQKAAAEVLAANSAACLVPLLPKRGFDNANALLTDFRELLEQERNSIEERVVSAGRRKQAIGLILISRTKLREPLIASPVTMPEWFPYVGGRVMYVEVVEVASSAYGTLRRESDTIARLQTLNYEIEGLLLHRLTRELGVDKNRTAKFLAPLLADGEKPREFLVAAQAEHVKQAADGFRAVASPKGAGLLGRIVAKTGDHSPNQLPGLGRDFFLALGLTGDDAEKLHEPLFAVAMRSTVKEFEGDRRERGKRNALLALYWSSQLVTAASHAGDYGTFQVPVMRSALLDCESALTALKMLLC